MVRFVFEDYFFIYLIEVKQLKYSRTINERLNICFHSFWRHAALNYENNSYYGRWNSEKCTKINSFNMYSQLCGLQAVYYRKMKAHICYF